MQDSLTLSTTAALLTDDGLLTTTAMQDTSLDEGTDVTSVLLAALADSAAAGAELLTNEEVDALPVEQMVQVQEELKASRQALCVVFNDAKRELEALKKSLGGDCDDNNIDLQQTTQLRNGGFEAGAEWAQVQLQPTEKNICHIYVVI